MPRQQITSRQNERVKQAAKLRDARQRAKQSRFVIDGVREIERALAAGVEVLEAFVCPALCATHEARQLSAKLDGQVPLVAEVTVDVFEKLAYGNKSDSIVAVAATPERSLLDLSLTPRSLVAVLEGLEKPGNVGAVLRSADGAGVDAVVIVDPRTDLFNPNTVRASVGSVFSPHIYTATAAEALARLREQSIQLVATRPDAKQLYSEVDYAAPTAIILGNEATGLSAAWDQADVKAVRLPMRGIADSLNVSTAAAILFYEARRQRDLVG